METTTKTSYTTWGSVCGSCGHQHRTIDAAVKCRMRHSAGCCSQGGYSDRDIYSLADGHRTPLTDLERYDAERYEHTAN